MCYWNLTTIRCAPLLLAAGMTAATAQPPSVDVRAQARILGTGSPVVLLGGGLLGADGWGGVPSVLANTHRVVKVQSLAVQYGLDDRPLPANYSLTTEVAALRAALDGFAVQRADLIRMSHGGVTALLVALDNPQRVRTLTLIEPPAFWVLPNHGHDDPGAREMQKFVGSLRDARITDAHVEQFRCLLGDCADGRSPRHAPQWAQWVKYRHSLRALHAIGDYDDDPAKLRTLSVPALVVHGASTVPFHRSINTALLRALPNSRSFELAGGHNSPASSPDYFRDVFPPHKGPGASGSAARKRERRREQRRSSQAPRMATRDTLPRRPHRLRRQSGGDAALVAAVARFSISSLLDDPDASGLPAAFEISR